VLQCVAGCCSVTCEKGSSAALIVMDGMQCVLQCVTVCCSVLQCVAVCYSVLQCDAM